VADTLAQGKKKWSLTPEAFDKLLTSLDPDRERAGQKYVEVRDGLVCFFEWRGCPFPEDHADETFNRVARKLGAGETVSDPTTYVYGVARLLLLEIFREQERQRAALANLPPPTQPAPPDMEGRDDAHARSDCLAVCLDSLPPEHRGFIVEYYRGERSAKIENRKKLAEQLGIPPNALRLRARRLREKLEVCVEECVKKR
jgi:DNA-directed RNA polymerase specialized sigma24 family protein